LSKEIIEFGKNKTITLRSDKQMNHCSITEQENHEHRTLHFTKDELFELRDVLNKHL
jgi:hypothetical protein